MLTIKEYYKAHPEYKNIREVYTAIEKGDLEIVVKQKEVCYNKPIKYVKGS